MRQSHPAGEKCFVDYAAVVVLAAADLADTAYCTVCAHAGLYDLPCKTEFAAPYFPRCVKFEPNLAPEMEYFEGNREMTPYILRIYDSGNSAQIPFYFCWTDCVKITLRIL